MNWKQIALIIGIAAATSGTAVFAGAPLSDRRSFDEGMAEALCTKRKWPPYPDSYHAACVDGARIYFDATH